MTDFLTAAIATFPAFKPIPAAAGRDRPCTGDELMQLIGRVFRLAPALQSDPAGTRAKARRIGLRMYRLMPDRHRPLVQLIWDAVPKPAQKI